MKALKFIDLAFQTLILGAVIILSLGVSVMGQFTAALLIIMYGAVFLGPWQLVSSIATCISRGHYFKMRLIHLFSSIAFIVFFSVGAVLSKNLDPDGFLRTVGNVLAFIIPAALAGLYYYITLKSFQLARRMARAV